MIDLVPHEQLVDSVRWLHFSLHGLHGLRLFSDSFPSMVVFMLLKIHSMWLRHFTVLTILNGIFHPSDALVILSAMKRTCLL